VESGIGNPSSTLEVKRNSLESLQKQLRNLTGGKEKSERGGFGGKAIARGAGIQLPDNIEAVLPVNPDKDPAEYLFLYGKLLGAGRSALIKLPWDPFVLLVGLHSNWMAILSFDIVVC